MFEISGLTACKNILSFETGYFNGENLRHDHVLITVNIFRIKRK